MKYTEEDIQQALKWECASFDKVRYEFIPAAHVINILASSLLEARAKLHLCALALNSVRISNGHYGYYSKYHDIIADPSDKCPSTCHIIRKALAAIEGKEGGK